MSTIYWYVKLFPPGRQTPRQGLHIIGNFGDANLWKSWETKLQWTIVRVTVLRRFHTCLPAVNVFANIDLTGRSYKDVVP